eukprot:Skav208738  [mRNA]  locus=scaffold742:157660:158010:- [translate_table: standard]
MLLSQAIAFARAREHVTVPHVIYLNRIVGDGSGNVIEHRLDPLGKQCKRWTIMNQVIRSYATAGYDIPQEMIDLVELDLQSLSKRDWERRIGKLREKLRLLHEQETEESGLVITDH